MKRFIVLAAITIFTLPAFTQTTRTATANEHAKELLKVMNSSRLSQQMLDMMIASYKENLPQVPTEFWNEFQKEVNVDELMDMIAPLYAKHFTDEELVQLIAFYKTPLGRKLSDKTGLISQESYSIGEEWGRKIGEKAAAKLKEKGYLKNG